MSVVHLSALPAGEALPHTDVLTCCGRVVPSKRLTVDPEESTCRACERSALFGERKHEHGARLADGRLVQVVVGNGSGQGAYGCGLSWVEAQVIAKREWRYNFGRSAKPAVLRLCVQEWRDGSLTWPTRPVRNAPGFWSWARARWSRHSFTSWPDVLKLAAAHAVA